MSALLDGRLVAHTDENGKKSWFCVECEYTQKSKKDVVKHIERRHLKNDLSHYNFLSIENKFFREEHCYFIQ